MNSLDQIIMTKAQALISSYRICYGVRLVDVKAENGAYVIYLEIPKRDCACRGKETSDVAKALKNEANELLREYGVNTEEYQFKVRYKSV